MKYEQASFIEGFIKYDIFTRSTGTPLWLQSDQFYLSDHIRLFYNQIGFFTMTLDGLQYQIKPGDLIIIQPWQSFSLMEHQKHGRYRMFRFSPSIFLDIAQIPHLTTDMAYWFTHAGRTHTNHMNLDPDQCARLDAFLERYDNCDSFAPEIMHFSVLLEILVFICLTIQEKIHYKKMQNRKEHLTQNTMRYVETHYQKHLQMSDIAQELYVTEKHLCNVFKQETGFTLKQYINHCRINNAKRILYHDDTTPHIAYVKCGYEDYSSFLRMFKNVTGMTPSAYQKMCRRAKEEGYSELMERLQDTF